jgi:probable HAF family extracellular repeat protein
MVDIGNLGGTFAYPNSMNERDQVVGLSTLAGDAVLHPFSWERGTLTDIGTFGGSYGEALSVNDAGGVVGVANLAGDQVHHAFLWRRGVMTDLGTVGGDICSRANAINSSGQIVGNSSDCITPLRAFLSNDGDPMVDLNTLIPPGSGVVLVNALYINDRGQISGNAILDDGHERAYLLTPCDDDHHPGDCRSDMFVADASGGAASVNVIKAAPTGDEHISSFSDLLHQLQQRRQSLIRRPTQ